MTPALGDAAAFIRPSGLTALERAVLPRLASVIMDERAQSRMHKHRRHLVLPHRVRFRTRVAEPEPDNGLRPLEPDVLLHLAIGQQLPARPVPRTNAGRERGFVAG